MNRFVNYCKPDQEVIMSLTLKPSHEFFSIYTKGFTKR